MLELLLVSAVIFGGMILLGILGIIGEKVFDYLNPEDKYIDEVKKAA